MPAVEYDSVISGPAVKRPVLRLKSLMKTILKRALVVSTVLLSIAFAAAAQAPSSILLEVEPGYNPDQLTYEKQATVSFNGKKVTRTSLNQSSATVTTEEKLHKLTTGSTLTVDASFANPDGTDAISCSRTWTAIGEGTIGCGPIEVGYQAYNDSCVIVCN